ncbi:DUF5953 family protein [Corallococcus sp. BB11-1]|uniref:DUF5953 family protein n=1 Tax=Corallococcus sp. BB11-1 TaxID=2996783 RepID=UPI002271A23D|nr:DUF5953 family protein [Corallococcus sp. BB11-1]MCY1032946.1 DUF5953 family protein [Corallococcus sp. BB11-1]
MVAPNDTLRLKVYAPWLVDGDTRPLAVVHGMEHALPGLRLAWTISDEGQFIPLPQRDAWVLEPQEDRAFRLLCNGDESHFVTLSGLKLWASAAPGGQTQLDVQAELPLDATTLASAEAVLEAVAEGAHAHWGRMTPGNASMEIALQTARTVKAGGPAGPPAPPRGLPALKLCEDIRSPEIPYYLGWLNYWSAATVRTLGFPDPARDAELLSRSRRTPTGGWVVRLTEAPLDLDNPSHLEALLRAYERFPEIGGRSDLSAP